MKLVPMRMIHGEEIIMRITDDGHPICPICGVVFCRVDQNDWMPYAMDENGITWPSQDPCTCCGIEYGHSDMVSLDAPIGAKAEVWEELRIRWLNEVQWAPWAIEQLRTNLDVDAEKLRGKSK